MKIQVGEIKMKDIEQQTIIIRSSKTNEEQVVSSSKTTKYLLPCLKKYGEEFVQRINKVYKIAAGIGDAILINRDIKHEKEIFLLLDGKSPTYNLHLQDFLLWIRDQPMYVDDYAYGDIQKSTFHMVIIKFPESYYSSFETFKIGDYSKMYELGDIEKYFETHPKTKAVLVKDHEYRVVFTRKLNRMFGSTLDSQEYNGELDLPPTDITEIFNHHLKI